MSERTEVTGGDWEVHKRATGQVLICGDNLVAEAFGSTSDQELANAYLLAGAKEMRAALGCVVAQIRESRSDNATKCNLCDATMTQNGACSGDCTRMICLEALAAAEPPEQVSDP